MMGTRAEDKYNPYFDGEFITGKTENSGVVTSLDNFLDALMPSQVIKNGFILPEEMTQTVYTEVNQVYNLSNNVIAFEITSDRHLGVKYVNSDGIIISKQSSSVITTTGFTIISVVYTPYTKINDANLIDCAKQRMGDLKFYINGRNVWTLTNFPEFYFRAITNDKEKQIGVPYSISWGGGSFGLEIHGIMITKHIRYILVRMMNM